MNNKLAQYKRLLALSQAGLYYGKDVFDKERFEEIRTISLELISEIGKEAFEEIKALTVIGEGHPTPKVDVRAYIKKDGKILLIEDKRTKEWSLPGGFAEIGLSPEENVRKEVYEETGLTVESTQLRAVFDTNKQKDIPQLFQYYKLVFACTIHDEDAKFIENNETSDMGFFSIEELPKLSEKRTTKKQLLILENKNQLYCD
ncbi:NUDIX domain-containing protein [Enterococcus faecium]|uniref:NUDIX hydrolase n=1 Tax=Enterococcus faecium TaxID=1352 RepID=UPI000F4F9BC5|nr:NUDIX hydrolase [Enterococcus faecium]EME7182070.1 NUDIX hydrolase [Enterococcus faecium]ROX58425.1 NUDIX domain-containing protein [Enterococcus faecium]